VIPHNVICDSLRRVAQSHGKMSNNDTNFTKRPRNRSTMPGGGILFRSGQTDSDAGHETEPLISI